MSHYLALIEETETLYGLVFPDCPGCTAMGETFDEVFQNGVEALREWMTDRITDGFAPPRPRDATALRCDSTLTEDFASGAVIATVPLLLDGRSAVRAEVSLDAGLLVQIDEAAKLRGLTRSDFLAAAARDKIAADR